MFFAIVVDVWIGRLGMGESRLPYSSRLVRLRTERAVGIAQAMMRSSVVICVLDRGRQWDVPVLKTHGGVRLDLSEGINNRFVYGSLAGECEFRDISVRRMTGVGWMTTGGRCIGREREGGEDRFSRLRLRGSRRVERPRNPGAIFGSSASFQGSRM